MKILFVNSNPKKYLIIAFVLVLITFIFLPKSSLAPVSPFQLKPTPTSIKPPQKHLIKTAFVPQAPEKNWDQPWQDACEEAALLTVHYYYQNQNPNTATIVADIQHMLDFEAQQQFSKDVNIDQMAQIGNLYLDYQVEILENPTLNQIKSYLLKNIPVIIPANGKQLFAENRYFSHGGPYYHNLVILGFNDKKEKFTVHDVGTQHGAYFKYSYKLLLDSIHDFPNSGRKEDINYGPKKVLLLLQ